MENELKVLKAVVKANLSKLELKIILQLLKSDVKIITTTRTEIAHTVGITPSNLTKNITKLEKQNVIGHTKTGIFVKSMNSWKAPVSPKKEEKE